VTISNADKAAEYVDFAQRCLKIAKRLPDRESRVALREMAAEWTMLASQSAMEDAASQRTRKKARQG
jgi:hypothetical protein